MKGIPRHCLQADGKPLTAWPCPYCGTVNDAATEIGSGDHRPSVGDIVLCHECGGIGHFDELMLVAKMNEQVWETIPPNQQTLLKITSLFFKHNKQQTNPKHGTEKVRE